MGQAASEVRRVAEASKDEAVKKTSNQIKILQELGRNLVEKFHDDVRIDNDPKKFKIGKILTEYSSINLMTQENTKNLKKAVGEVVKSIVKGEIASVITTMVSFGIDAMVASSSGSVAEKRLYTVKLEGFGLQRIDIYLYQYDLTVQGAISECQKLFVYAYTISTIGEKVTVPMLRSVIALAVPGEKDGKILDQEHLIQEQNKIFNLLRQSLEEEPAAASASPMGAFFSDDPDSFAAAAMKRQLYRRGYSGNEDRFRSIYRNIKKE